MKKEVQLNLNRIAEASPPSLLRKIGGSAYRAFVTASSGFGLGAVLVAIFGGLAVAAVAPELIGAIVGAAFFGAIGFGVSMGQYWRYQKRLGLITKDMGTQKTSLKESILKLILGYQLLEEDINACNIEKDELIAVSSLNGISENKKQARLAELEQVIKDLQQLQASVRERLSVVLEFMVHKDATSNSEKLLKLFDVADTAALKDECDKSSKFNNSDKEGIRKGLDIIWPRLNEAVPNNVQSVYRGDVTSLVYVTTPVATPPLIKHPYRIGLYTLTVGLGFIGGGSLALGLGVLVAGVAFLTMGWPMVVGVIAGGLLFATGSLIHQRFFEKKQTANIKELRFENRCAVAMTESIKKDIVTPQNINSIKSKLEAQKLAAETTLNTLKSGVELAQKKIDQDQKNIKSLGVKMGYFQDHHHTLLSGHVTQPQAELKSLEQLKKDVALRMGWLIGLEEQLKEAGVDAPGLNEKITQLKVKAEENAIQAAKLYQDEYKDLHLGDVAPAAANEPPMEMPAEEPESAKAEPDPLSKH